MAARTNSRTDSERRAPLIAVTADVVPGPAAEGEVAFVQ